LCGMGVVSAIERICNPWSPKARTALSRPGPGPLTSTSTWRKPCSKAFGRPLQRELSRKRSRLLRAFVTEGASARPGNDIALLVGDGHDRVIEGAMNMSDALGEVALHLFLTGARGFALASGRSGGRGGSW
jgi:hypothetical protein